MPFDLQGHRGARGLKPENTLPSIEAALDAGVSTIETDLHLTRDGVPVLCHDPVLNDRIAALVPGQVEPPSRRLSQLTLAELHRFTVAGNPDPQRFPGQDNRVTPLASEFADHQHLHPYGVPTLAACAAFVAYYAANSIKNPQQRACAGKLRFDLELKRVPFEPETIGDAFDGGAPGLFEQRVVEEVRRAGVVDRTIIRSFDHRCVRAVKRLEPRLPTAVLIAGTIPASPVTLAREAAATIYCPEYRFVDRTLIEVAHAGGLRVIPWTVNPPDDWERLVAWGVDGLTTDYPDRLAAWLGARHIAIF